MAEKKKVSGTRFEKGHEKVGGRKKGTPNKYSIASKEQIVASIFEPTIKGKSRFEEYWEDYDSIADASLKMKHMESWIPYILPKMQSVAAEVKVNAEQSVMDRLDELEG